MAVFIGGISGVLTLKEYVNQTNPKRYTNVKLKKSEVDVTSYAYGEREVTIKKFPEFTYIQKKNDYRLYTRDRDGNPKRSSVFLLDYK